MQIFPTIEYLIKKFLIYEDFERSYYKTDVSQSLIGNAEFRRTPLFVIDCSQQPEAIKLATVDIKIEIK